VSIRRWARSENVWLSPKRQTLTNDRNSAMLRGRARWESQTSQDKLDAHHLCTGTAHEAQNETEEGASIGTDINVASDLLTMTLSVELDEHITSIINN
jgi:hypothetical protein